MCNCNESMRSDFEIMTSSVTSVISLDFCSKIFENIHLTCVYKKTTVKSKIFHIFK